MPVHDGDLFCPKHLRDMTHTTVLGLGARRMVGNKHADRELIKALLCPRGWAGARRWAGLGGFRVWIQC